MKEVKSILRGIIQLEMKCYYLRRMKKDTRLTFRVSSKLKAEVEDIAQTEGESVARICEAFLAAGLESYRRRGPKLLQRYIGILGRGPSQ